MPLLRRLVFHGTDRDDTQNTEYAKVNRSRRLDIAVQDALTVRVSERLGHLNPNAGDTAEVSLALLIGGQFGGASHRHPTGANHSPDTVRYPDSIPSATRPFHSEHPLGMSAGR